MDIATQAANWSAYRNAFLGRIMLFPRIVADKDVRPSDLESCDLILFGTKETNKLIEKYSDRLPVQLNASAAADHGLFFVFPADGHYIAVNSGLPWWNGAQTQDRPFLPQPYLVLPGLKDFILFKEPGKNIIAEGYFDQRWKLPEEEAKKITASGAAIVK